MEKTSPKFAARITGILFFLTIVAGIFAEEFVRARLVVSGDAASTATNILAHRSLFEWSFTVYMIEMACQIMTTALFYFLLRPVSRSIALVAVSLSLCASIIKTFSRLFYIAPLLVLDSVGTQYLQVFSPQQLQALALLFLKLSGRGAAMALAFFGIESLLNGYLVFRSRFLPRVLGILWTLGGVGWLSFFYPPAGNRIFLYVALFALLGSAAMIFWLIVFGLNEGRWRERAARSG